MVTFSGGTKEQVRVYLQLQSQVTHLENFILIPTKEVAGLSGTALGIFEGVMQMVLLVM